MLQPVRSFGGGRPSWFKVFIFWVLVGAYLAAWIYAIYVIADSNSYESSIEEARCHAAVVGCSMTCANTVRQADPDKGQWATHEFHAPCTDCHGEQLRAAGASLSGFSAAHRPDAAVVHHALRGCIRGHPLCL